MPNTNLRYGWTDRQQNGGTRANLYAPTQSASGIKILPGKLIVMCDELMCDELMAVE